MPPSEGAIGPEDWERILEAQKAKMIGEQQTAEDLVAAYNTRAPSKAHLVGTHAPTSSTSAASESARFIVALAQANSRDAREQAVGKATIESFGSRFVEYDPGKATLGTSGATGAYIMPNAVVERVVAILTAEDILRNLMTWVDGVAAPAVQIPLEASAATATVVTPWGQLKPNEDVTFAAYTATMYTLAKIHDISNQLLRHSAGAAEVEVTGRLGRAMALGEAHYLLSGSGTAEPKGLLTSLAAAGTFDTNKGAATTTIATSIPGTIVAGIKALALRSVQPDAILLDPVSYWTAATEATTTFSVLGSMAGQAVSPISLTDGGLRFFGLPMYASPIMPANTGLVGAFRSAVVYTGLGYRIDTSDQAGSRWDYNLTGFRAEEEFGFNADPYVFGGRFQRLTNLNT